MNEISVANPLAVAFGGWGNDGKFHYSRNVVAVESIADASRKWCEMRDRNNLRASESPIVMVIDTVTGERIAKISFNGRAWGNDGKEIR